MLYIDTDGFLCQIKTDDVYKDMYEMNIFDMSCYDPKFKYYRPGKYEMRLLRDESPMTQIIEAVSLKDKLYGYIKENDELKCKGMKNDISFQSLKMLYLTMK